MLRFIVIYRHAFLAGIISWLSLYLMHKFSFLLVFVIITVVWLVFLFWFFYFTNHLAPGFGSLFSLLIFTAVAFTSLLALIEGDLLRIGLELMAGLAVGSLFFIPRHQIDTAHFEQKPWRRFMMMLWVFDAYAIISVLFAFAVFFPNWPFTIFAALGAVTAGYSALSIWHMYFSTPPARFLLWSLIVAFISLELIWVAFYLPFGYLVLGFIVTWIWYLLQLFIRFHLTVQGIEWKKQIQFIATNAVLMIGFMVLVVRWI